VANNKPVLSSSLGKGCDKMCGGEEGLLNEAETDRVSQALTGRIKQLAERYATPLSVLPDDVATLTARVEGCLDKVRFSWN